MSGFQESDISLDCGSASVPFRAALERAVGKRFPDHQIVRGAGSDGAGLHLAYLSKVESAIGLEGCLSWSWGGEGGQTDELRVIVHDSPDGVPKSVMARFAAGLLKAADILD